MEKLLKSRQDIRAKMSIKVHLFIDKFLDNYSDVSDEQEERFYQDIKAMEEHYLGWWDKRMMADHC